MRAALTEKANRQQFVILINFVTQQQILNDNVFYKLK